MVILAVAAATNPAHQIALELPKAGEQFSEFVAHCPGPF